MNGEIERFDRRDPVGWAKEKVGWPFDEVKLQRIRICHSLFYTHIKK